MADDVLNIIRFPNCSKETIEEIKKAVEGNKDEYMEGEGEADFDFNKLIPVPDNINDENWYDWSCKNWGTEENSYYVVWGEDSVEFCTAWSATPQIIQALSKRFPQITMFYEWADNDYGYAVGTCWVKDGETFKEYFPKQGTADAQELAFSIWDVDPDDIGLCYNEQKDIYE